VKHRLGVRVVIGIGNAWRGDDAAGLAVARRLRTCRPPGLRVVEREGEPLDLLDEWADADEAIVVDAVRSGSAPGTIHRIEATEHPLPVESFNTSSHLLGVGETVELGRALGRLPGRLIVRGIEGGRFETGARLSPEVERAAETLVAELARPLHEGA
jgi:hydrogenase maturation protease